MLQLVPTTILSNATVRITTMDGQFEITNDETFAFLSRDLDCTPSDPLVGPAGVPTLVVSPMLTAEIIDLGLYSGPPGARLWLCLT